MGRTMGKFLSQRVLCWRSPLRELGFVLIVVALWTGVAARAALPLSGPAGLESMDLATGFEEPLIATGPTSAGEDEALARAVNSYRGQAAQGDFQALEGFLADHPGSGWRVSILTNLGLSYYHSG